jgi:hypothetical protein
LASGGGAVIASVDAPTLSDRIGAGGSGGGGGKATGLLSTVCGGGDGVFQSSPKITLTSATAITASATRQDMSAPSCDAGRPQARRDAAPDCILI